MEFKWKLGRARRNPDTDYMFYCIKWTQPFGPRLKPFILSWIAHLYFGWSLGLLNTKPIALPSPTQVWVKRWWTILIWDQLHWPTWISELIICEVLHAWASWWESLLMCCYYWFRMDYIIKRSLVFRYTATVYGIRHVCLH